MQQYQAVILNIIYILTRLYYKVLLAVLLLFLRNYISTNLKWRIKSYIYSLLRILKWVQIVVVKQCDVCM